MIAIVMRRQAGSKRLPEWEEIAATACAVQNMHLQSTCYDGLACYWSSWHAATMDSSEMRDFLKVSSEDRILGFFVVAACRPGQKDRRLRRKVSHLSMEVRK